VTSIRVFLVEDQPALLKQLQRSLSAFPELELVGSAQDGEAAVELVPPLAPDLVLLDLELPGIDGIEVTRRLRRRAPGTEILILTSFDDEQKVYEAIQAGAAGYLVKRVGPEKIRQGIRDVLDGGTVLEAQIAKRFWNYFHSLQAQPAVAGAAGLPEDAQEALAVQAVRDPWNLSELELEVLRYIAKGLSNAEVGRVMTLERRSVRTHLTRVYRKMGVDSHVEAVVLGLRAGLVQL
jgi:DNA-binding NarL/FixJ family response regulator